jgi:hypothetical protein
MAEHFSQDPHFPALIVGGSIARGWEREDSDIDVVLVASDEEYARRVPGHAYHYWTMDFCDYPGGYIDGKVVDWQFLQDVAARGSEPARAAFVGVFLPYSRLPGLEDLIQRIATYPEHERQDKIQAFYAQVQTYQWYVGEAERLQDPYLLTHVVSNLVLFGGRLILAHNRILFPYHKWFLKELAGAPDKPVNLMDLIQQLLESPCKQNADAFCESVLEFTDWGISPGDWASRFIEDTEWAWRKGRPPIADW